MSGHASVNVHPQSRQDVRGVPLIQVTHFQSENTSTVEDHSRTRSAGVVRPFESGSHEVFMPTWDHLEVRWFFVDSTWSDAQD